ncbi:LEA type 2 family protein [Chromatocurvus halotolerans]|uniref:LEA14-like dessication related protein n=1 Tax=Chromatocurvus halotolerans TaxID=1132028 RepID=A0A4R2KYM3_9GAMM|nr:LEA type 2 family protein [Chromatocurvus halotolerans]TCO75378.1 LEA14-like dessication related protein [Chromatocurvus halotolerans]
MRRTLFPLALGTLLALLTGCATSLVNFDAPEIDLVGLKPLTSRGMEARFAVQLRVLNPNTLPLNVDGLHYQVYLRDQRVLSGVSAEPVRIPGYGEDVVDLEASAGVLGSLALLRDLMSNPPQSGLPYRLEVKLSVDRSPRPLRIQREGMLRLSGG